MTLGRVESREWIARITHTICIIIIQRVVLLLVSEVRDLRIETQYQDYTLDTPDPFFEIRYPRLDTSFINLFMKFHTYFWSKIAFFFWHFYIIFVSEK